MPASSWPMLTSEARCRERRGGGGGGGVGGWVGGWSGGGGVGVGGQGWGWGRDKQCFSSKVFKPFRSYVHRKARNSDQRGDQASLNTNTHIDEAPPVCDARVTRFAKFRLVRMGGRRPSLETGKTFNDYENAPVQFQTRVRFMGQSLCESSGCCHLQLNKGSGWPGPWPPTQSLASAPASARV